VADHETLPSSLRRRIVDGRFDDWVVVRFQRGSELTSRTVSIYGEPHAEELLGACWILGLAGSEQIVITLYPRTAAVGP